MPTHLLKSLALETRLGDENTIVETIESSRAQQTSAIGALLEKQLVAENDFLREMCAHFGLPYWENALPPMDEKLRQQFPARLALRYHLYPVRLNDNDLYLLTYDPFNLTARQVIAQEMKEPVTWCVAHAPRHPGRVAHRLRRRRGDVRGDPGRAAKSTTPHSI